MSKWQQPYGSNGTILTNDILLGVKDYLLLRKFRGKLTKNAPSNGQRKLTTFNNHQSLKSLLGGQNT